MAQPEPREISARDPSPEPMYRPGVFDQPLPDAQPEQRLASWAGLAGRILLSHIFLFSGIHKIIDPSGTAAVMDQHGMVLIPFFLVGAIVLEVAGGLSLLLGCFARWGALLLVLFLIPTTLVFHSFWTVGPEEQQVQMIMFMKNLAIMGGLLMVMSCGPGALSIDAKVRRTT
jgi:putative oxidoreductase